METKIMDETNRVAKINAASLKTLEELLDSFENESLDKDQFLSETYARLIAAELLGYSAAALVADAQSAVQRLLIELAHENEATDEN
jgi:hypothetical protein